jgi:hypothetical protein
MSRTVWPEPGARHAWRCARYGIARNPLCDNESAPGGATNTLRGLTRSTSTQPKEGLAMKATCSIEECTKNAVKRGWCPAHYQRWRTTGDPLGSKPRVYIDRKVPVRRCCNPKHLEPVTPDENRWRGRWAPTENAKRTHCQRGHEFTDENTYFPARGGRQCRECMRMRDRRRRSTKVPDNAR